MRAREIWMCVHIQTFVILSYAFKKILCYRGLERVSCIGAQSLKTLHWQREQKNGICKKLYVFTVGGTSSWTLDIFDISQPNWLKFGLQAHFLKMFGHSKFQPSSICSFRFLLVNFSRHFQTFFSGRKEGFVSFLFFPPPSQGRCPT